MDLATKKRRLTKESKRRDLRESKEGRSEIAKWRKGMSQGS